MKVLKDFKKLYLKKVFALVEEETRRYKPTKNYLEVFGPVNYHLFEVIFIYFSNLNRINIKLLIFYFRLIC